MMFRIVELRKVERNYWADEGYDVMILWDDEMKELSDKEIADLLEGF